MQVSVTLAAMTNSPHTPWCARDHRCAIALGEHRAPDITIDVPGTGRALLTRVRTADGVEHAEMRMRIALPDYEPYARARMTVLLAHLRGLVGASRRPSAAKGYGR